MTVNKTKQGTCPICKTNNVVLKPVEDKEGTYYVCGDCLFKRILE